MRVLTHGPIEKLDLTARACELVEQHHLLDIVARQAVGCGKDDAIQRVISRSVTQPVEPWASEGCATVAVVTVDVVNEECPALGLDVRLETVKLLVNHLELDLVGR